MNHSKKHQLGTSLVSVVVGIGLLGIGFMILNSFVTTGLKSVRAIERRVNDLQALRHVRLALSCSKTKAKSNCRVGRSVTLYQRSDKPLLQSSGSKIGETKLRAVCTNQSLYNINIEKYNETTRQWETANQIPWSCDDI